MTYEEFQKALAYFDSISTPFPDLEYELKIRKIFQEAGEQVFMKLRIEQIAKIQEEQLAKRCAALSKYFVIDND